MKSLVKTATAATFCLFFVGACSRKPEPSAVAGKLAGQNFLLITLDTTRADRLGCYGYKVAATPVMDELASRGVLFENAFAQVPLTLPSHCSIMTGRYPREHGVRDNGANALGPSHPTLAGIFKEHGYQTGAFVASFVLDSRFGLERGFDTYSDDMGETTFKTQPLEWQQPANVVTDRALAWLDGAKERPFFCWVHYYDPHQPYQPPVHVYKPELERYDGELAFVDLEIKRLMDWLQTSKLTDRTLIVVVGDHGEAFGEHGENGHSNFVYKENLHVPMFFAHPTIITGGKRVPAIVEALDVFPTVLELYGYKPPGGLMSRSLAPAFVNGKLEDAPAYGESLFVYNSFAWAEQRSLTTSRWKYVSSAKPELFDCVADPRERENVISKQPTVAAKLLAELKDRYESMTPGQAAVAELDPQALAKIQSLGYLGGSKKHADEFLTEGLPDPKDLHDLLIKLKLAKQIMDQADNAQEVSLALPLLYSIVRESPNSRFFHFVLGTCLLKVGQREEAVKAFQAAIKLEPGDSQAYGLAADALMRLDRFDDAVTHFELALKFDDRSADLHFRFGELLQKMGRLDEAVTHYERALELFPTFAAARARLAGIYRHQGRNEEAGQHIAKAIAEFHQGIQKDPRDADLRYRLGMTYVQTQNSPDAIVQFREALKLKPDHAEAILNLGVELEGQGNYDEAEALLRRAIAIPEVAADSTLALGVLVGKKGNQPEAVKLLEKSIEMKPTNPAAIEELGSYYLGTDRIADAIRILRIGTEKIPDNVTFLNMLAKLLSTSQNAALRDGRGAVTLALKASQLTKDGEPQILGTLAAAYAEAADFAKAIETARKALQLAVEKQQDELATLIRSQLEGYLANRPYRDPRW